MGVISIGGCGFLQDMRISKELMREICLSGRPLVEVSSIDVDEAEELVPRSGTLFASSSSASTGMKS